MTDHKTRTGFVWGAVAGAALAIIFPPSILAGAALGGVVGAAAGKVGNVAAKSEVAKELADVITPGTSGILAVVDITAVDAVKRTIPQADEVKAVPVDKATADAVERRREGGDRGGAGRLTVPDDPSERRAPTSAPPTLLVGLQVVLEVDPEVE
jgi:hypothetical protein